LELSKLNFLNTYESLLTLESVAEHHQDNRQRRLGSAHQQEDNMGFQHDIRKTNMGLETGMEKRGRARLKSRISVRNVPKAVSKDNPGNRVGASQHMPITLDSDDDAPPSTTQRYVRKEGSHIGACENIWTPPDLGEIVKVTFWD
jgi:hypothetical protein